MNKSIYINNKNAGFWFRLLVLLCDLILFLSVPIGTSVVVSPTLNTLYYPYYLWIFGTITWLIVYFILIPFWTRGFTIAKWIFRIRVVQNSNNKDNYFLTIIKSQIFFGIAWIIAFMLAVIFVTPHLAYRIAKSTPEHNLLPVWEQALIAIPSTYSTILILVNFYLLISIIINKESIGSNDKYAKIKVIYLNKHLDPKFQVSNNELKPIKFKKKEIIFLKGENDEQSK